MTRTTTEDRTTVTATGSRQEANGAEARRRPPRKAEDPVKKTRRRAKLFAGLLGVTAVIVTSGCSSPNQNPVQDKQLAAATPSASAPFAWFQAGPAPEGWTTMELPDGTALLSIPPGATPTESDAGSVSAALAAPDGSLLLYLNATPQQGEESQANWPAFRLDHLKGENAASATQISNRTAMMFRGGSGTCVADRYVTRIGAHEYREMACLVAGSRGGSVLVVATPAESWDRYTPLLEQVVDSYLAE
jgi:hypothetical protein